MALNLNIVMIGNQKRALPTGLHGSVQHLGSGFLKRSRRSEFQPSGFALNKGACTPNPKPFTSGHGHPRMGVPLLWGRKGAASLEENPAGFISGRGSRRCARSRSRKGVMPSHNLSLHQLHLSYSCRLPYSPAVDWTRPAQKRERQRETESALEGNVPQRS